jgi:hypothetical protein
VQSRVGINLWQADPNFKVQFLLPVRVHLYGFHRGYLSLTLVQTPLGIFAKRTTLLISWNDISDCYSVSSVLICDLEFLLLSPHLLFASVLFRKWYKNVIFLQQSFIQKISLTPCN